MRIKFDEIQRTTNITIRTSRIKKKIKVSNEISWL